MAFEPYRAAQITDDLFCFAMLAAINLDHQPRGKTNEIGKVRT